MAENEKTIVNPPQISCTIEDLDGQKIRLVGRRITKKNINEYFEMVEKSEKLPIEEKMVNQMSWVYGNKPEDYENFDIRVLRAAIFHFSDSLQNPI